MQESCSYTNFLQPLGQDRRGVKAIWAVLQTVQGVPKFLEIFILDAAPKSLQPILEPPKGPGVGRPAFASLGTLSTRRDQWIWGGGPWEFCWV
eukprot:2555817-Pyramimonas_sp.AAC.1